MTIKCKSGETKINLLAKLKRQIKNEEINNFSQNRFIFVFTSITERY